MTPRAVEILFRHKLLLVMPFIIVLPLTVALALRPHKAQWQTSARIWVQQNPSIYADPFLGSTPALSQANLLSDFVHSRSFALAVLQQTPLGAQLHTQKQADTAVGQFRADWVGVKAVSNNFIDIVVTMPDQETSYQTIQGIISNYQATVSAQEQALSEQAVKLYGNSVQQAQDALTQAQTALAAYLAQHPALDTRLTSAGNATGLPDTARDPNVAALTQNVANAQTTYNGLRDHYLGAQAAGVLNGTFAPFAFKVIDPPIRPSAPIQSRRLDLLKIPAVGLAFAALMSLGIGTLLLVADHTVIGAFDLEGLADAPVLGEIPDLSVGWPVSGAAVRRQLLSPALSNFGAAPPSRRTPTRLDGNDRRETSIVTNGRH